MSWYMCTGCSIIFFSLLRLFLWLCVCASVWKFSLVLYCTIHFWSFRKDALCFTFCKECLAYTYNMPKPPNPLHFIHWNTCVCMFLIRFVAVVIVVRAITLIWCGLNRDRKTTLNTTWFLTRPLRVFQFENFQRKQSHRCECSNCCVRVCVVCAPVSRCKCFAWPQKQLHHRTHHKSRQHHFTSFMRRIKLEYVCNHYNYSIAKPFIMAFQE